MINIDKKSCKGCGLCTSYCPVEAIKIENGKAVIDDEKCLNCLICVKTCPFDVLTKVEKIEDNKVRCSSCPVQCTIPEGSTGACKRFENINGELIRNRNLAVLNRQSEEKSMLRDSLLSRPLITAVGSGTNYPCCRPAPFIVEDEVDGVEVVTVVTEAPLSYSGVKVKIDTNMYIGEEGAKVKVKGKVVGMVTTEEYGSKMLTLGGANLLSGNDGVTVASTVVTLANGERVELKVDKGAKLELQSGQAPIIDGKEDDIMRIGCGSATIGMFASAMKDVVDEAIILDHHVIGLLSEHMAGEEVGMEYSGVIPCGNKSTRGRYFGEHGKGWGGTRIENPADAIQKIDMNLASPGMRILVTETTGRKSALFNVGKNGEIQKIEMTDDVLEVVNMIKDNCEPARVSVVYTGGTGGSARAGVTTYPINLTQAVHRGDVKMTIGGAKPFILPGGGINFMVDTEQVVEEAFTWVPTPATVAPVEYSMEKEKYKEIGGHMKEVRPLKKVLKEISYDEIE